MELIRLNKRLGSFKEGELLLAKPDGDKYVIDICGHVIHASHCQVIPHYRELHQENLMHRENVRALMAERDELREYKAWMDGTLHGKAMQLLKQTEAARQELLIERSTLLQQIERTLDEQKVVIPREVAEAIEKCEAAGMTKYGIMCSLQHIDQLFRDYPEEALDALRTIKKFAQSRAWMGVDVLMTALVNGYTVEQTPDERLMEELKKCVGIYRAEEIFNIVKNIYAKN